MSRTTRRLAALTALAMVPLSLAGCAKDESKPAGASSGSGTTSTSVSLIKAGTLTVCTHAGFRPFEFVDNNKVVGFDIDLADLVAAKAGVKAEIVDVPFDQMTSGAAFKAKRCDIAIAAITINDKRKAAILFSDPYFESTQALLVKKGSAVKDLADLKGKKLGVQTDTTGKEYAEKEMAAKGYQTVTYEDGTSLGNGVKTGAVEAGLNDNSVQYDFAKGNSDTEVVKEYQTGEMYGMAVDLSNTGLAKIANDALAAAKSDGKYEAVYVKWLGKKPAK